MIINKKLPRLISVISSRVLSLKFISYLKVIDFRSFIFSVALPLLLLLLLLLSIWRIEWSLADVMIYTAHAIGCSHSSISSSSISTKQEWYWMIDSVVGAGAARRLSDCLSVPSGYRDSPRGITQCGHRTVSTETCIF